jgi:hypothetical protein
MIRELVRFNHGQLLAPWKQGEELDDAVFRIAATFPMRTIPHRAYQTAGDELYEFDPNVFVQQLVEETGISHTWEPIPIKMPEGMGSFHFSRLVKRDQVHTPFVDEREARLRARELLWAAWDKYHHFDPGKLDAERHASFVAGLFGDFVLENIDLAQQLMAAFSGKGEGMESLPNILTELERRAKVFMRPIPPTQNPLDNP